MISVKEAIEIAYNIESVFHKISSRYESNKYSVNCYLDFKESFKGLCVTDEGLKKKL